jgi:hypothetical protein
MEQTGGVELFCARDFVELLRIQSRTIAYRTQLKQPDLRIAGRVWSRDPGSSQPT